MRIGEILTPEDKQALLFAMYGHYGPEHRDLEFDEHRLRVELLRAEISKQEADASEARARATRLNQRQGIKVGARAVTRLNAAASATSSNSNTTTP